jgi:NADH dehydrogenase
MPRSHDVSDPARAPDKVLITGANGHLGRRLIARLAPRVPITAVVRSSTARRTLEPTPRGVDVVELDYRDSAALSAAAIGCVACVHLVGILKETAYSSYVDAHERATRAVVDAGRAQRLQRIVYVSILGAHVASSNAALASKGRAERILSDAGVATTVLRVPMVLGEGDYAAQALRRRAYARLAWLVRGESLEQPIYAGDVVDAIVAAATDRAGANHTYDLAGPQSLSRSALVERAAELAGRRVRCVSLPIAPVRAFVRLLERVVANPPVTSAMLGVLDHDDCIDPRTAAAELGIRLTGVDEMLRRCVVTPNGPPKGSPEDTPNGARPTRGTPT